MALEHLSALYPPLYAHPLSKPGVPSGVEGRLGEGARRPRLEGLSSGIIQRCWDLPSKL